MLRPPAGRGTGRYRSGTSAPRTPPLGGPSLLLTPHTAGGYSHMEATLERIKAIFLDSLRRYVEGPHAPQSSALTPLTYLGGLGKIHPGSPRYFAYKEASHEKADKNLLSGSTTLLVLSLLSSGDKYGYEMIAELEARSDHTFTLKGGHPLPHPPHTGKDGAVKSYEKRPHGPDAEILPHHPQGACACWTKEGRVGGIYPYRQRHSGRNQSGPGMKRPGGGPHRTISQFCDHVCMYVRFRPDHEAITAELTAHLEGSTKAAILETRPDMPLREAERRAVEAMGNPGRAGPLAGLHPQSPLGVAPDLVRAGSGAGGRTDAALFRAPAGNRRGQSAGPAHVQQSGWTGRVPWSSPAPEEIVVDFRPEGSWTWEGYTFSIHRAVVLDLGDEQALYYLLKVTHPNPWNREPALRDWLWAEGRP